MLIKEKENQLQHYTLKHYAVMDKYTPLERSSLISSLISWPVVFFFTFIQHQSSYGL